MGQQVSTPTDHSQQINELSRDVFEEIDKYTLKKHANFSSDEEVLGAIGLTPTTRGFPLLLRSAHFFASYPNSFSQRDAIVSNLLKVIGFYSGKIPSALKLSAGQMMRLLFLSLAVQTTEASVDLLNVDTSKYYIAFTDFVDLVALLCSVYDKTSSIKFRIDVTDAFKELAQKILEAFKAPIISFDAFSQFMARFPYLNNSFQILWDQLLFEKQEPEEPKPSDIEKLRHVGRSSLKAQHVCLLYLLRGPDMLDAIKLYHAKSDGYSMRAFESKVVNWKAPTFFVVKGKRLNKDTPDFDQRVPRVTDTTIRDSSRVQFIVYVDRQWKVGNKRGFAGPLTTIYQVEPDFSIFAPAPTAPDDSSIGYFSPSIGGIGIGLPPPQTSTIRFQKASDVALFLDRFLEYGSFRCVGEHGVFRPLEPIAGKMPYEDRFSVSSVEAWGIGGETILAAQKREWEWEKREAARRKNVNVGEDRSILELAGIVGQYDPNRGTN